MGSFPKIDKTGDYVFYLAGRGMEEQEISYDCSACCSETELSYDCPVCGQSAELLFHKTYCGMCRGIGYVIGSAAPTSSGIAAAMNYGQKRVICPSAMATVTQMASAPTNTDLGIASVAKALPKGARRAIAAMTETPTLPSRDTFNANAAFNLTWKLRKQGGLAKYEIINRRAAYYLTPLGVKVKEAVLNGQ